MSTGRFGSALARPGAARFFVPAAIARWGVAMSGLSVFWIVHGSSGSLAEAGVATGVFSAAEAVIGPQISRFVDSFGQRRVLPVSVAMFLVSGIALMTSDGAALALAAVMGATVPPVGALSAARWRLVTKGTGLLPTALSLESAVNEMAFLLGPVLVTVLVAVVAPWSALALVLGLVVVGMTGLLTAGATEPVPVSRAGLRGNPRFLALIAVNLAMGSFFGGIGVALSGFTLAHNAVALTGAITATGGVVSLVTGLTYGSVANPRWMFGAGSVIAVGCAVLAAAPNVLAVFLGYAVVGGCVSLILIPSAVLLQDTAAVTQAMTWINSASAVGVAAGAPLVGLAVEHGTWRTGFLALAALSALVPASVLLLARTGLRPD